MEDDLVLPTKISDRKWYIGRVTNNEILRIYSIPFSSYNYVISAQTEIFDNLLPFIISWTFLYDVMEDDNRINKILYYFTIGDNIQCDTAQCYFTSSP